MSDTSNGRQKSIAEKLHDLPALEAVLKRAARDAIRQHAIAGNPIAVWKDDRLVIEVPKLEDYPPLDDAP
jgi:hypothetical protein